MWDSFERGDYDRFRQLARAPGGRKLLEDNAETLLSSFLERDSRRGYQHPRRSNVSRGVAGLRVLLEEVDPTPVNIQALLSRILLRAVFELDVEKAEVCLQAGASPNAPVSTLHELSKRFQRMVGVRVDSTGFSEEKLRQQKKIVDMAECLCEHGADVHKADGQGSTPVQLLLQSCGKPTQRADEDKHVGMTIDACAPVQPKPGKRPCPYDECAAKLLAILMRHGGKLPEHLATCSSVPHLLIQGFSALVMEMVENGASVHTADDLECTPLHCAILYGSPEVVECMLRRGGPEMGLNFEQSTESVCQPTGATDVHPSTVDEHPNTCHTELTKRILINAAVRRGSVSILQLLQKVGIVATNRTHLLMAAFSLDPAVVQFLLSSSEWTDTDIVDAPKLQAAVFTAVHHLKHGHGSARKGRDEFGLICPPDLLNCFEMEEAFLESVALLSYADELLLKAVKDFHSSEVKVSSDQIHLLGDVVREAANADDVDRLKRLKPLPTTSGDLCGMHFHALLVLKRLAPESQLYLRYLTALASSLWNDRESSHQKAWLPHKPDRSKERTDNLLICYELLLQLPQTGLAPGELQPNVVLECFSSLAAYIARLVQALCQSELVFDAVPLIAWLTQAVRGAASGTVKEAANLIACVLSLLAQATSSDVRQQVQAASQVVGAMETTSSGCGNEFSRSIMLNLLGKIGATRESRSMLATNGTYSQENSTSDSPLCDSSTDTPTEVLETVLVALVDAGIALPEDSISNSFLEFVAIISRYGTLFKAMVRHPRSNVVSRRYLGLPLLAFAVQEDLAEAVESMLEFGAGQDWLDFQKSHSEKSAVNAMDTEPGIASPFDENTLYYDTRNLHDLPDIAARHGNCRILRALHRSGISTTASATLFAAALHTNPDTLEFLLATQSWTTVDVCDALRLQSAYCLIKSLSAGVRTCDNEMSTGSETSAPHCTACLGGLRFHHSSACPLLSTAFRTFARAVAAAKGSNLPIASLPDGYDHCFSLQQSIQQDVVEAQSEDDLQALGRIEFPSVQLGRLVRGWHFHALLVMERLHCPLVGRFLKKVIHALCSPVAWSSDRCGIIERRTYRFGQEEYVVSDPSGDVTSMSLGHMQSVFACIDISTHLEKVLLLQNSPKSSFVLVEPHDLLRIIRWIGELSLWLITNGVAIDYTAVFSLFSRLMTTDMLYECDFWGKPSVLGFLYVDLFFACILHKEVLGRHQLMEIVQQLVAMATHPSAAGKKNVLDWLCDALLDLSKAGYYHLTLALWSDDQVRIELEPTATRACLVEQQATTNSSGGEGTEEGCLNCTDARLQIHRQDDKVMTEAVLLLLENGLTPPDAFRSGRTLHQLLSLQFSSLLKALAEHWVDIWSSACTSLIVRACKTSSAWMVNCLLECQATGAHHTTDPDSDGWRTSAHNSDNLWVAALQCADVSIFRVLLYWRVPATKAALLESAMKSDRSFVTFMLEKLPFTAEEAADALKLHSAYCLLCAIQSGGGPEIDDTTICARISLLAEQLSSETTQSFADADAVACPLFACDAIPNFCASGHQPHFPGRYQSAVNKHIVSALESFKLSLKYSENRQNEQTVLNIAGHRIKEAQSWDDFKQLAQVSIPTQFEEPLSGVLLHSLLIVERVLPKHSLVFCFFEEVSKLLGHEPKTAFSLRHQPGQSLQLTREEEAPPELIPVLAQYSLLTHHLRLWQEMTQDELGQVDAYSLHDLSIAATAQLRQLLASGIIVDTLPVFCWLNNHAHAHQAFGFRQQSDVLRFSVQKSVLQVLTDMVEFHQQSVQISTQLHRAAALLVKGSLKCAVPCDSILHCAVKLLICFPAEMYSHRHTMLTTERRSDLMKLVRILLHEGGPDLVNLVNGTGETAAHAVISVARNIYFVDEYETFLATAMELLTLFDEYGQHWDRFYNSQHSLLEELTTVPELSLFCSELLCQPQSLQCLSATVAVAWCDSEVWKGLPENIKRIVLQHQSANPPTPSWSSPDYRYCASYSPCSTDPDAESMWIEREYWDYIDQDDVDLVMDLQGQKHLT